jgi:PHP family Zn ribbon phosphoesterase
MRDPPSESSAPFSAMVNVMLKRSWPCSSCGKTIRKGANVRVQITAGGGRNRVFHRDCPITPAALDEPP